MSLRKPRCGISIRSCLACVMILAGSVVALGSSRTTDVYVRTNFTVEDGLPDNVVNAIIQTGNGLLWVGTHVGVVLIPRDALDQFDPKQLIYYQPSPGASDEVESLYQTRDGAIWVGTNHGLYRKESGKFVSVIS